MKRLFGILGVCVLLVSATGGRAYGASVEKTCAALQSFSNDAAVTDPAERIAAGRARLREAQRAADKSGDRRLAALTRRFRTAFTPAVEHPNKAAAQRALNMAGVKLWTYCSDNGFPIRRSTTTTTTTAPPATG